MKEGVLEGDEAAARHTVAELMAKYDGTTGAEQRRILAAIGQVRHASILSNILEYSLDGTVRKQDSYMAFASVARNRKVETWKRVKGSTGSCAGGI